MIGKHLIKHYTSVLIRKKEHLSSSRNVSEIAGPVTGSANQTGSFIKRKIKHCIREKTTKTGAFRPQETKQESCRHFV